MAIHVIKNGQEEEKEEEESYESYLTPEGGLVPLSSMGCHLISIQQLGLGVIINLWKSMEFKENQCETMEIWV